MKTIKTECQFWLAPDTTTDICLKIKGIKPMIRVKKDSSKNAGHGTLYPRLHKFITEEMEKQQ